ncbi:hypothetical protein ACF0H5_017432 [Mactra antiquata]
MKDIQKKVIDILLCGKDCICSAPTGYGKSVMYVLIPFIEDDITVIVIVPLNAIIKQQIDKLCAKALSVCLGFLLKRGYRRDTLLMSDDSSEYSGFSLTDGEATCRLYWAEEMLKNVSFYSSSGDEDDEEDHGDTLEISLNISLRNNILNDSNVFINTFDESKFNAKYTVKCDKTAAVKVHGNVYISDGNDADDEYDDDDDLKDIDYVPDY